MGVLEERLPGLECTSEESNAYSVAVKGEWRLERASGCQECASVSLLSRESISERFAVPSAFACTSVDI